MTWDLRSTAWCSMCCNHGSCIPVCDHHFGTEDIEHHSARQPCVVDSLCQVLLCLQVHVLWHKCKTVTVYEGSPALCMQVAKT